jgi:hypothetical protein
MWEVPGSYLSLEVGYPIFCAVTWYLSFYCPQIIIFFYTIKGFRKSVKVTCGLTNSGISELVVLLSRNGAAVHTCAVQRADKVGKALDVKEATQVETKYALMRPEEVSHQKQLEGYITVDQPVGSCYSSLY